MKRWILLACLVVVLTSAATVAVQFLPDEGPRRGGIDYPAAPVDAGPQAKAELVGEPVYKFETAPQYSKLERDWVIKNTGTADLQITIGPPACSCTIAK